MVGRPVDATVSVVAAGGSYLMKCFVTNWVGGDRLCTASKQCVGDRNWGLDSRRKLILISEEVEHVDNEEYSLKSSSTSYMDGVRAMNRWKVVRKRQKERENTFLPFWLRPPYSRVPLYFLIGGFSRVLPGCRDAYGLLGKTCHR